MIDWLSIRHFAIASEVDLELGAGFTAVTGETGSGKSLMVDALAILLGGRADQGLIQQGKTEAEIRCGFNLSDDSPVWNWLREHDLASDSELILRRIIRRDKPGRNYINGNPVNVAQLREVGAWLVDIHGQHEHHSLMKRSVQQALLDEAAGAIGLLADLSMAWDRLREVEKALERIHGDRAQLAERIDLLSFQLNELDQLSPAEGEWDSLSLQQKRLSHSAELIQGIESAMAELHDEDDAVQTVLNRTSARLRQLERIDPAVGEIASLLEEADIQITEAVARLRSAGEDTDMDPAMLQQIDDRLSAWHAFARKHRVRPEDLAGHRDRLARELAGLEHPEAEEARLVQDRQAAYSACEALAGEISARRRRCAPDLSARITEAMQELGMTGGRFEISLEPVSPGPLSRTGTETVSFHVSANAGQPLQPMSKVASGGEISRISLAIQVILANAASVPTLIFDEVDVGIGGTVANAVGNRLRQIGETCQVISVTHLPQVASRANAHYSVAKLQRDDAVDVSLTLLDRRRRIEEIARMSGSDTPSNESLAHAEQMLQAGNR